MNPFGVDGGEVEGIRTHSHALRERITAQSRRLLAQNTEYCQMEYTEAAKGIDVDSR